MTDRHDKHANPIAIGIVATLMQASIIVALYLSGISAWIAIKHWWAAGAAFIADNITYLICIVLAMHLHALGWNCRKKAAWLVGAVRHLITH